MTISESHKSQNNSAFTFTNSLQNIVVQNLQNSEDAESVNSQNSDTSEALNSSSEEEDDVSEINLFTEVAVAKLKLQQKKKQTKQVKLNQ